MRKMAYAAPLVLSFAAAPAFASSGSSSGGPKRGESSPNTPSNQSLNNRHHH